MNIDINEESDTNLHHNHLIINSGAFESFADQVQNKINYENQLELEELDSPSAHQNTNIYKNHDFNSNPKKENSDLESNKIQKIDLMSNETRNKIWINSINLFGINEKNLDVNNNQSPNFKNKVLCRGWSNQTLSIQPPKIIEKYQSKEDLPIFTLQSEDNKDFLTIQTFTKEGFNEIYYTYIKIKS